jgi:2'-5' RNA ligase
VSGSSSAGAAGSGGSAESAIIVPVEVPMGVRRLRDRLDPSAAQGVPAHVTLLYPFMPLAALTEEVREEVGRIVAAQPAFSFALTRVERWPDVVWLAPEPDAPFRALTERLATAFPDYPPYGGAYPAVVPHLTVAQDPRPGYLEAAEHALPALLPIRDVCREAWLIAHAPQEPWHTVWRLALGSAR